MEPKTTLAWEQGLARASEDLARFRRGMRAGSPPTPADLARAQDQARADLARLVAALGLDRPGAAPTAAQLEAYEGLLGLNMELSALGLELARTRGPSYLPPPGAKP